MKYLVENKTFPPDEIAARFHRNVVWIHSFPNGNGRHSRMVTDTLLKQLGKKPFSWGGGENLVSANELRTRYLAVLRAVDKNDCAEMLAFVRG